jgi:hypothetical protein
MREKRKKRLLPRVFSRGDILFFGEIYGQETKVQCIENGANGNAGRDFDCDTLCNSCYVMVPCRIIFAV